MYNVYLNQQGHFFYSQQTGRVARHCFTPLEKRKTREIDSIWICVGG